MRMLRCRAGNLVGIAGRIAEGGRNWILVERGRPVTLQG